MAFAHQLIDSSELSQTTDVIESLRRMIQSTPEAQRTPETQRDAFRKDRRYAGDR